MGMSSHVVGFRAPDEKWQKMKAIYDACEAGKISVPDEVENFFDGMPPDPSGVEVRIPTTPFRREMQEGFEVDIKNLPADITAIRFYNSW